MSRLEHYPADEMYICRETDCENCSRRRKAVNFDDLISVSGFFCEDCEDDLEESEWILITHYRHIYDIIWWIYSTKELFIERAVRPNL